MTGLGSRENILAVRLWWAYGEHAYGERRAMVEADDWEGPRYQTCMDAAMVCRAFETSRRREVLSFTAHREAAALPVEWQDKVLQWAIEGGHTMRAMRDFERAIALIAEKLILVVSN